METWREPAGEAHGAGARAGEEGSLNPMAEKEEPTASPTVTAEDLRGLILHVDHLEEKVQTLTRRLAAVESRAQRFADFFRYLLLLYDRVNARLHLLDGLTGKEEVEEVLKSRTDRKPRLK